MKNFLLLLLLVLGLLSSCRDSSETYAQTVSINGKIINKATGESVANYPISLIEKKTTGTGILGVTVIENEAATKTDPQGNFSFRFQVKHREDDFLFFSKGNADYSSISHFANFSDLGTPKILQVGNFEKLDIYVKNILPEPEEGDKIKVYVYENNEVATNISSIENFGTANQPFGNSSYENGLNTYWIGKNVNSVIHTKVERGRSYQIFYDVTKNGLTKLNQHSEIFEIQSEAPNIFVLDY